MSYTDLRDFECEFSDFAYGANNSTKIVQIEKLGGGELNRTYTGIWRYRIIGNDGLIENQGQNLEIPVPKTHREAYRLVCDYFNLDLDPIETGEI